MLYKKMLDVIQDVNTEVAEREEVVELLAIALLTRKNMFLLGDTGQAKSQVINLFRDRIAGTRQFELLLTKQTDEGALFGTLDLKSYMDGESRLNTADMIPESDIVFLDEIFKSNEAILNSLLTAMNERRFTNHGVTVDIPVISFFSASNEIPNFNDPAEKILLPLYDRFDIKVLTQYIQDRDTRLETMQHKQNSTGGTIGSSISLAELETMQREVRAVAVPGRVNELMDDILCNLREKGIHISDRKYFGYYPLAQAKAYLGGRSCVGPQDLLILKNYLWMKPEQIGAVDSELRRLCVNPMDNRLSEIRAMADECLGEWNDNGKSRTALRVVRDEFVSLYDRTLALAPEDLSRSEAQMVLDFITELNGRLRSAYETCGMTFVPLEEQKLMV
ncbi:AAA family ATPase [Oscillospiraceae bacterium OttesenSCG-928-F05]|nr:AAA family ATPase [Oscillospiraceae bacterium OttesenSCG-928-F05]